MLLPLYIKGLRERKGILVGFCLVSAERKEGASRGLLSLLFFFLFAVSKKEVRSIVLLCMLASIDSDVCVFLWFS